MKSLVLWESPHLKEVWDGEVTKCVRRGHDINIVFNCTDLGEGQITLADDTGEQILGSRFLYYGRPEPTRVSVRGRLTRRADVLVFDGVWTDPIDGTGEWKFTIEIEDFEVQDARETKPDTLPPQFLTPWYQVNVQPARAGLYQVRVTAEGTDRADTELQANWDGEAWSIVTPRTLKPISGSGWDPEPLPQPGNDRVLFWRGLTEAGYLSMQDSYYTGENDKHTLG